MIVELMNKKEHLTKPLLYFFDVISIEITRKQILAAGGWGCDAGGIK